MFRESSLVKEACNYSQELDLRSPSFFNNKNIIRRSINQVKFNETLNRYSKQSGKKANKKRFPFLQENFVLDLTQ